MGGRTPRVTRVDRQNEADGTRCDRMGGHERAEGASYQSRLGISRPSRPTPTLYPTWHQNTGICRLDVTRAFGKTPPQHQGVWSRREPRDERRCLVVAPVFSSIRRGAQKRGSSSRAVFDANT